MQGRSGLAGDEWRGVRSTSLDFWRQARAMGVELGLRCAAARGEHIWHLSSHDDCRHLGIAHVSGRLKNTLPDSDIGEEDASALLATREP